MIRLLCTCFLVPSVSATDSISFVPPERLKFWWSSGMPAKRKRVQASEKPAGDEEDAGTRHKRGRVSSGSSEAISLDGDGSEVSSRYAESEAPLEGDEEEEEESAFRRGNIRSLRMKNFLTFDNVVFEPGPNLNLVIGKEERQGKGLMGMND